MAYTWATKWQAIVSLIIGVITLCVLVWGGFTAIDKRYQKCALADEVHKKHSQEIQGLDKRLDVKIVGDVLTEYDKQIWSLEDRNKCHTRHDCETVMDPETRTRYRGLLKSRELKQDEFNTVSQIYVSE